MKLNRLETHDRFEHFTRQSFDIGKTCQSIIDQQPFGPIPFYIFAHKREIGLDEQQSIYQQDFSNWLSGNPRQFISIAEVPNARIIWQPRLTKPKAQTNSMLFKAYPPGDNVKVIWILPPEELWEQYTKDKMTENKTICESIHLFKTNKKKLEQKEDDDFDDKEIDAIYKDISVSATKPKFIKL